MAQLKTQNLGDIMHDEMPAIDIDEALNRSMGDVDFLKMMLEELHRTIPNYTARIQQALKSNDAETLGSDAHQFKGAAANMGAKAMAHAAFQLEQIGKSGSIEGADEAFGQLKQTIASFNQYLMNINWANITAG
jgi:two-component system sensor histidine kinase/response regulator